MKQFMGIRMFSFFPCLRVHCLDRYHFGWQSSKIWRCYSHWAIPVWIKSLKLLFHLDISEIQNTTLQEKYQRTDLMETPMLTWKKYCDQIGSEGIFGACLQRYIIRLPANHCFPNMLNFSHNNLTKMIPKEIGHLKSLATLNSAPTCYQERFHHITP